MASMALANWELSRMALQKPPRKMELKFRSLTREQILSSKCQVQTSWLTGCDGLGGSHDIGGYMIRACRPIRTATFVGPAFVPSHGRKTTSRIGKAVLARTPDHLTGAFYSELVALVCFKYSSSLNVAYEGRWSNRPSYFAAKSNNLGLMNGSAFSANDRQCAARSLKNSRSNI
jgi:hypothetical protein